MYRATEVPKHILQMLWELNSYYCCCYGNSNILWKTWLLVVSSLLMLSSYDHTLMTYFPPMIHCCSHFLIIHCRFCYLYLDVFTQCNLTKHRILLVRYISHGPSIHEAGADPSRLGREAGFTPERSPVHRRYVIV